MTEGPLEMQVSTLVDDESLAVELLTGEEGLERVIRVTEVQKPGLALAGHLESIHAERVQILGYSEISYLEGLPEHMAWRRVKDLCSMPVPCVMVTRGLKVPDCLLAVCREEALPLLQTPMSSAELIAKLRLLLIAHLTPCITVHGVLVDVFGVGILILGRSGVGKSETAMELVLKGHRLVADDIVEIRRRDVNTVYGSGPKIIKHHMEIRGLGILNIKDLFGVASVRDTKKIEQVIELEEWDRDREYDRLGVDSQIKELMGVEVPRIRLPVRPGRNISAIIEVAARNQLLKFQGHHSAREFQERLIRAISSSRSVPLVESDVE
jgi:HPr kinase/phosphorylase